MNFTIQYACFSACVQGWRISIIMESVLYHSCLQTQRSHYDPRFYRPIAVLPTLTMVFECVIDLLLIVSVNFPLYSIFTVWIFKGTGAQDCGAAMSFTTT